VAGASSFDATFAVGLAIHCVATERSSGKGLGAVALLLFWAGCGSVTALPVGLGDGGPADGGPADTAPSQRRASGAACTEASQCTSGFCVDGVCCRTACSGGCASCNQVGRAGACWPIDVDQPDPRGLCTDQGPGSCGTTGKCDGFAGCAMYAPGVVCGSSRCVDGAFQQARVCDGRGTCGAAPAVRACAPYMCQAAGCPSACLSDAACVAPSVCLSGACRPLPSVVLTGVGATPEIGEPRLEPSAEDQCPAGAAVVGFDVTATSGDSSYVARIRAVCGALVMTHAGSIGLEVGEMTALTVRGTGPGTTMALRCPKNQVVVGYDGRSGSWIDQLSFRCAPLLSTNKDTAVVLGPVTKIGPVGGDGGDQYGETDCGPSQVSVGSRARADFFVMTFALSCAKVSLRYPASTNATASLDEASAAGN
jgi:hypothetical protein